MSDKLIPAIAQDWRTGEVLMLAYMNDEALAKTRKTGKAHYWSRSRKRLWLKGESSGHLQQVKRYESTAMRTLYCCWSSRRVEHAIWATDPASIAPSREKLWERRSLSPRTFTNETGRQVLHTLP